MVNPFVAGSLVARYSFPGPIPLKFEHKLRNVTINKVLKMLTSFLWSIGVQPMKNCCRFVFYMITLTGLMSIFLASVLISNIALDQTAREKSLSYCKVQNCTRD